MRLALSVRVDVVGVALRAGVSVMIVLAVGEKEFLLNHQVARGDGRRARQCCLIVAPCFVLNVEHAGLV